jgi:predicted nucleotidyltransferase
MADVQITYARALETLIAKVRTDNCIVAAVLVGSLAYDTVWERSDIDLILVTEEAQKQTLFESVCLVEDGVIVHCNLVTRSQFRKLLEAAIHGSFVHSLLGKGEILFSRDETLVELFEARHALGDRDRSIMLLSTALRLLPGLTKAEKWFHAKKDYDYCLLWIMKCVDGLASLELLLGGEVPSREVIQRALVLNPALFRQIYTDLIHADPTPSQLGQALTEIGTYLRNNVEPIFGPLLDYLRREGEIRSITEINHFFSHNFHIEGVDSACEWLADEGFIDKLATPVRLTTKSRVSMEEAAYYLPGEDDPCP